MALLFLGFKNYRLCSHREGFEAVQTFCGQRRSWEGQFFVILCWCIFGRPLIHIFGSCIQWHSKGGKWGPAPQGSRPWGRISTLFAVI